MIPYGNNERDGPVGQLDLCWSGRKSPSCVIVAGRLKISHPPNGVLARQLDAREVAPVTYANVVTLDEWFRRSTNAEGSGEGGEGSDSFSPFDASELTNSMSRFHMGGGGGSGGGYTARPGSRGGAAGQQTVAAGYAYPAGYAGHSTGDHYYGQHQHTGAYHAAPGSRPSSRGNAGPAHAPVSITSCSGLSRKPSFTSCRQRATSCIFLRLRGLLVGSGGVYP
jgi:hypothetical protein